MRAPQFSSRSHLTIARVAKPWRQACASRTCLLCQINRDVRITGVHEFTRLDVAEFKRVRYSGKHLVTKLATRAPVHANLCGSGRGCHHTVQAPKNTVPQIVYHKHALRSSLFSTEKHPGRKNFFPSQQTYQNPPREKPSQAGCSLNMLVDPHPSAAGIDRSAPGDGTRDYTSCR